MILRKKYAIIFLVMSFFYLMAGIALANNGENDTLKVGYVNLKGFMENNQKGFRGFGYDYLVKLSTYTGWQYEYIFCDSYSQLYDKLVKGEIDLFFPVIRDYKFQDKISFAEHNFIKRYNVIYASQKDKRFNNDFKLEELKGKKIGVLRGYIWTDILNNFCQKNNISLQYVYFASYEKQLTALQNGEIDLLFGSNFRKTSKEKVIYSFCPADLTIAFNSANQQLLKNFNNAVKYLQKDDPEFELTLFKKYYGNNHFRNLDFTSEEIAFIRQSPVYNVAVNWRKIPLNSSYDNKKQLMDLIARTSGLKFNYVNAVGYEDLVKQIKNQKIDIICSLGENYAWAEKMDLFLTNVYLDIPLGVVFKKDYEYQSQEKIALYQEQADLPEYAYRSFNAYQLQFYPTIDECLDAVENGQADIVLSSYSLLNDSFARKRYRNLAKPLLLSNDYSLCLGISRQFSPLLVSILNKSLQQIAENDNNAIFIRYVNNLNQQKSLWETVKYFKEQIFIILLISLLFFSLCVLYSRKKKERVLKFLAETDPLTGLMNRLALNKNLDLYLKDESKMRALLIIDLDHFKEINDNFGHAYGDQVLQETAQILSQVVTGKDLVARIGGDEFVLFLTNCTSESNVYNLAGKINNLLERSYRQGEKEIQVSGSIGVGFYSQHGKNFEELFNYADNALYESKRKGRNCYS